MQQWRWNIARSLLSLKLYVESIRAHCPGLSREELVEPIVGLAKEAALHTGNPRDLVSSPVSGSSSVGINEDPSHLP